MLAQCNWRQVIRHSTSSRVITFKLLKCSSVIKLSSRAIMSKRNADHLDQTESVKAAKSAKCRSSAHHVWVRMIVMSGTVFPIFSKQPTTNEVDDSAFRWISPAIGPNKSCLHGVHLEPQATSKLAAFDLDGCLIESSFGKGKKTKSDKDKAPSFTWWRPAVPKKLKQLHEEGSV